MDPDSETGTRDNKRLLAFVHVEKAAGTSLIHVLRQLYCGAHLDVRPFSASSSSVFTASDLCTARRVLPGLRCIAGHSVVPWSDLCDVDYVTLLRDPVKRYLSHYQHWVERKGCQLAFEEFLANDEMSNFQTKKIAGSDDLERAKGLLGERFLLAGCVEDFDAFLVLLARLTSQPHDRFFYTQENKALNTVIRKPDYEKYMPAIRENNASDIQLYGHVKEVFFPACVERYGADFKSDLDRFCVENTRRQGRNRRHVVDYLLRKAYLEPVTGLLRLANGLPYRGSY